MSCIFTAGLNATEPQTHALVIGVGAYHHLPGGERADGEPAPRSFGLGQLTSSVVSAVRFAEWLLTRHHNPAAPLGTLTLLLSPRIFTPTAGAAEKLSVPAGAEMQVDEAAMANIETAFGQWYGLLNAHRDNIGLFFFSGHGLEASDRYLVPADFGANPRNVYDRLINFTATHNLSDHCLARTQCYFLDACRLRPDELISDAAARPIGKVLIGPQPGVGLERDAPIFHAAARGDSAAGAPGQISYFAEALIQCLEGTGARDATGEFCPISHTSLGIALKELLDRVADEKALALRCVVDPFWELPDAVDLHLAPGPVQVLTTIMCEPPAAHQLARLSLHDRNQRLYQPARSAEPNAWKLKIPAGKCRIEAAFEATAPWDTLHMEAIAFPPHFKPPIWVKSRPRN